MSPSAHPPHALSHSCKYIVLVNFRQIDKNLNLGRGNRIWEIASIRLAYEHVYGSIFLIAH